MSIFGGSQDPGDDELNSLFAKLGEEKELDLSRLGLSVDEQKVKHALWKDGFVAKWAMVLLLVVTALSMGIIVFNSCEDKANEASQWAMEIVKTVAVAFIGFLAGGASSSKGA